VDELYQAVFVDGFLRVCKLLWVLVDQGMIDGAVNLFGWAAQRSGEVLRLRVQNGQVRLYAGALLLGAVILLGLVLGLAPR
jgi:NADH:ubiquinone oxidoreductase subunit 5 (subunit L)/multisubunit Na+/H+ antiporter MnhA subunit